MLPTKTSNAKTSSSLKENHQVQTTQRVGLTPSRQGIHKDPLREIKQLQNQIAQKQAELDKYKKAAVSRPQTEEPTMKLIPCPRKIVKLQVDMGLEDQKLVYNQCRHTISDRMHAVGIKFSTHYKKVDPSQLSEAVKLAKSDYEPLRRYESDWALYQIIRGILSNRRSNQSKLIRNYVSPQKKAQSARATSEDDNIIDAHSNNEVEVVPGLDEGDSGLGDNDFDLDLDLSDISDLDDITGDGEKVDGDSGDIDGDSGDVNGDSGNVGGDSSNVEGDGHGDDETQADPPTVPQATNGNSEGEYNEPRSEPKKQVKTKKGTVTTSQKPTTTVKMSVRKGKGNVTEGSVGEKGGDDHVQKSNEAALRTSLKRSCKDVENTNPDTRATKQVRQQNGKPRKTK